MTTILVIADELELLCTLQSNLEDAGHRIVSAGNGQSALTLFDREGPDLVLLDLALSGMDSLEFCRCLRQAGDVPILVLTARVEQAEQVVTQEGCADDFVLKPFGPRQVVTRIQTLLSWAERRGAASQDMIRAGDLELNLAYHRVTIAGKPVHLTRTELELLAALVAEPGRAFTRSQLMGALNTHRGSSERTIDTHVKNLRAKIEPDPHHPRYVLTVYGVGYKLSA